jgi:integrase
MPDSTTPAPAVKPAKPHPDFPLTPHNNGRWVKKIRGKLHYFGRWDNPQAALDEYLAAKDDLLAGRPPRPNAGGFAVRDLVNAFLTAQKLRMHSGAITARSFQDYYATGERMAEALGKMRAVADLRPDDFDAFRAKLAAKWGPTALGNEIQRVRSIFKWGFETLLMEKPMVFGPHFRKPKRRELRQAKQATGPLDFTREEILALLAAAKPQLKAMILLGVNCGWGNSDVAELQQRHLDLSAGVADFPRPKTGIDRRAPLWPETVKAIRKALKLRPSPKNPTDAGCVFITKYGERWKRAEVEIEEQGEGKPPIVRRRETDAVGLEFGKLLRKTRVKVGRRKVSIKRPKLNFYGLRRTFETIGGETGDQPAVDRIMGHEDAGAMSTTYRQWRKDAREDARLRKVTEHVRAWLFNLAEAPAPTQAKTG